MRLYVSIMKRWPVQDAKNQLSQVIELARSQGPQTITRHGRPVVVVVDADEFNKLRAPKETPLEFFSRFKGAGLELVRRKDLPRQLPE
jgi:prevent-host-death family protein